MNTFNQSKKREIIIKKARTNIVMGTLIMLLFLTTQSILSQVCATGVTLTSQADVYNFVVTYSGTCNAVDGNFTITGTNITDISGLSFIQIVDRGLQIISCNITSLDGIQNISQSGFFRLRDCPNVISANLPSLTSNGSFYFLNNPNLTEINVPSLVNSNGNRLDIVNNPILSSIDLPNINSLSNGIIITDNPLITDLDFLLSLTLVGTSVRIEDNTLLNGCCFLQNYIDGLLTIGGVITLANNATDCNSIIAIGTACNLFDLDGDGINDEDDNCPTFANSTQIDLNNNGIGDDCENSSTINTGNDTGGVGINTTNPHSLIEIADGDIFVNNIHCGIILKAADGKCYRYKPDRIGLLVGKEITCPDN
ncbi:thrombospondin type 3 repeat-containing protein [Winogradskyella luteola]|uniref:Thrombospondin type 3 repeat-containing protein n=1 Tax=Winogradskyella luteola TaxID=2828330 RepID=A0A9X1JSK1_9FLAO|nr:thrombospondin type 3 repeat-containing protein [Winogradskyella luteola]MBV7269722.1 thrombospondin type 3 repeat-containing protein [Winogradskyella luteola]